jgi:hypothetical protein
VSLEEPLAEGKPSLKEVIQETWGDASYPAQWDDGARTELKVRVVVEVAEGCAERLGRGPISMPVGVTYGTADGRVEEHRAAAELTAAVAEDGTVRTMSVFIDDELTCEGEADEIPYTLSDCAELASVLLQLGLHTEGAEVVSAEGLNAYEYHRAHSGPPGSADRVRTLMVLSGE